MARSVILSNGQLAVGLNELGLVHDFYYPYVGLENLTTSRSIHHKIGIWCQESFSWVDSQDWEISVNFQNQALVSQICMTNQSMAIRLDFEDFVDHQYNLFGRKIKITNLDDGEREIRIFLHQVFEISRGGRADTALFVPEANYLLDYKGRCSLLIYAQTEDDKAFSQFAVGNYGIEGKEGTWRDAEDGVLSGSSVEHAGVDSVISCQKNIKTGQSFSVDYWIIAADSQYSAEKIHQEVLSSGLTNRLHITRNYWQKWLNQSVDKISSLPTKYQTNIQKSLMIIKAHCDRRGGIIASCDSSIYNYGRDYYSYVWPRDGAYAVWPLIRLGYQTEAKKFFEFCRDIITKDGYLMHKYQPDRAIGSTWHPLLHGKRSELAIQADETAMVIYMLGEYQRENPEDDFCLHLYETFIKPAANFLSEFIDPSTKLPHASYDLWEEKFLTTTYTTAITYQSLLVAADFANDFDFPDDTVKWQSSAETILNNSHKLYSQEKSYYTKGFLLDEQNNPIYDDTLDVSSLYGVMMFGLHDNDLETIHQTVKAIELNLLDKSPSGGTPRYQNDHYFQSTPPYLGNPWAVTTLWMAQYYARINQLDKTRYYLDWVLEHTLNSGVISEQIHPENGQPISVTPLVWSHAEYINTCLDLLM